MGGQASNGVVGCLKIAGGKIGIKTTRYPPDYTQPFEYYNCLLCYLIVPYN